MSGQTRRFICIRCPNGCEITTTLDGKSITEMKGNTCAKGEEYVQDEVRDPRRILTTTVRVRDGAQPLVPVWTPRSLPRDSVMKVAAELRRLEVRAPVRMGDVIAKDVLGTGSDVVASMDVAHRSRGS